jgi:uncharacterized protein YecE (DUF72 family)
MSSSKKALFVGVSGFSYAGWKGNFYPKDLKNDQFLEYYAGKLNSVEINSSFYGAPSNVMVKSWNNKTPDNFRFSFKAPRQITHILKLGKGSTEASERLGKIIELLGTKQGPVLFQLPPYLRQNLELLESFLEGTLSVKSKVFEFRHDSWLVDSTYAMLEKYDAGFCIAETEDMKAVLKVTGGSSYFRLRKDSYDDKAIDDWAKMIRDVIRDAQESYVYLRHDETGQNASFALGLQEKISG